MKYIYIEFDNGEEYRISASLIADKIALMRSETDEREVYEQEYRHAMEDPELLSAFVRTMLKWDDIKHKALFIEKEHTYNLRSSRVVIK